jgi:hypothetical protein
LLQADVILFITLLKLFILSSKCRFDSSPSKEAFTLK